MTAGKLTVGSDGRLRGKASLSYNDPWPTRNHGTGSGAMRGVVQHTMVGNLPGTVTLFNEASSQASAFFGVDQQGHIHQFIGVGLGLYSWAQEAGNEAWYSIEFADDGNPDNPMTEAQLTAGAQLVECLSAFAGFPLQEANSPSGTGLGVHYMGGQNWGGHTCPDLPPKHIRSAQRPVMLKLAKAIRAGSAPVTVTDYTTKDGLSLLQVAALPAVHTAPSTILRLTAVRDGKFAPALAAYINTGDLAAAMPAGIVLRVPAG